MLMKCCMNLLEKVITVLGGGVILGGKDCPGLGGLGGCPIRAPNGGGGPLDLDIEVGAPNGGPPLALDMGPGGPLT